MYISMPPVPDIDRPSHLQPTTHRNNGSHPNLDPVIEEEDEDTDDDHTLVDLKRKREPSTSQEGAVLPVMNSSLVIPRSLGSPLVSAKPLPLQVVMMMNRQGKSIPQIRECFCWFFLSLIFPSTFFFFISSVLPLQTPSIQSKWLKRE